MRQQLPLVVSSMHPSDISSVVAIDRLSFPVPWPAHVYLRELNRRNRSYYYCVLRTSNAVRQPNPRRCWAVLRRLWPRQRGGTHQVLGYVGLRRHDAVGHISTIAVHPTWRGMGLGQMLLAKAMERAMQLGLHAVTLEVRASNRTARTLYEKYGFSTKGRHAGYYQDGEEAVIMTVNLSDAGYAARLNELNGRLRARLETQLEHAGQGPFLQIQSLANKVNPDNSACEAPPQPPPAPGQPLHSVPGHRSYSGQQ
jgi:ribosomal-protein-alanine N-acetyltransferase